MLVHDVHCDLQPVTRDTLAIWMRLRANRPLELVLRRRAPPSERAGAADGSDFRDVKNSS